MAFCSVRCQSIKVERLAEFMVVGIPGDKMLAKGNSRNGVLTYSSRGHNTLWQGRHGSRLSMAGHIASTVGKQRERDAGPQFDFPLFIQFETLAHGMVLPTFWESFPTSFDLIKIIPPRYPQRCVL